MKRLGWVIAAALPLLGGRVLANDEKDQKEKQDQKEQKDEAHGHESVKLLDLPTAVQETFRTEASGGTVEELRKEERQGKVTYEGEVVRGGKAVDLEVSSDGKVLRRGPEHDESHENGED